MNYLQITHEDVCNGVGLRVVLWLSGCSHHCYNCQNPQTWNPSNGIPFDEMAKQEIFTELSKDYIDGITLTGGDPLHENNLDEVISLVKEIRVSYPDKNIWLYSGYEWGQIFNNGIYLSRDCDGWKRREILKLCNVMVDGKYIDDQRDITLKWRGSQNQKVIDIQQSLKQNKIILYCD